PRWQPRILIAAAPTRPSSRRELAMSLRGGNCAHNVTHRRTTVKHELKLEEWTRFEELIDDSIIERYDGDLERLGEGKHGELHYRPLDEDHIRQLLASLWGERLTAEVIEDAFKRLMNDVEGPWPHGYCEEDEEDQPLSYCGPE